MKLGIIETGAPPAEVIDRFGDYPSMFRRLLGAGHDYTTYDVAAGELPDRPETAQAYVVTGSPAGVYEPLPWIAPLKDFLVAAKGRAALVGVCFGHQIMAEAFGGKVIASPKGWGVGLHDYRVARQEPWMDPVSNIRVAASHQDQVVELPPGAQVLAGSDFTPFGMLAYRDQPAISIQLHPEFEPAYAKALIETRRGTRYTDAQVAEALASYDQADDRARLGAWITRFLEQSVRR